MKHFTPKSPDPFIRTEADMTPAKFGHLNYIIDILNQLGGSQSITAFATGGQTFAVPLGLGFNLVTTATTGDSVILPSLAYICACNLACGPLGPVIISNAGPGILTIYPALGETINGQAINIPITLASGASITLTDLDCASWATYNAANSTTPPPPPGGGGEYAEYVQHTQAPNNSIPPGQAIEYLTDNPLGVFDTIGITTATGPAAIGTAFQLPVGVYTVDYENSAAAASSFAIYQGASNTVLAIDTNTISGSSTGTTWIHGRAIVEVTGVAVDDWIMISSVVGTADIPTAGTAAGEYIARLTILKIA